jgi:hypothetical protein
VIEKSWYHGQLNDTVRYLNANGKVHTGPCVLTSVTISGDGAAGDGQVYDDQMAGDHQILHLEAESGTSFQWVSKRGIKMQRGIYVVVSVATCKVTLTYFPLSDAPWRRNENVPSSQ